MGEKVYSQSVQVAFYKRQLSLLVALTLVAKFLHMGTIGELLGKWEASVEVRAKAVVNSKEQGNLNYSLVLCPFKTWFLLHAGLPELSFIPIVLTHLCQLSLTPNVSIALVSLLTFFLILAGAILTLLPLVQLHYTPSLLLTFPFQRQLTEPAVRSHFPMQPLFC